MLPLIACILYFLAFLHDCSVLPHLLNYHMEIKWIGSFTAAGWKPCLWNTVLHRSWEAQSTPERVMCFISTLIFPGEKKNTWKRIFSSQLKNTAVNSRWSHELHRKAPSPSAAASIRFLPCYMQVKIQVCPGPLNNHVLFIRVSTPVALSVFTLGFLGHVLYI